MRDLKSIKTFNILFVFAMIIIAACNSSSINSEGAYQETKMTMEDQEKSKPLAFLSSQGGYRKNLLGEWVLEGTITNAASIASYKDVVLSVNYYSKTNTLLGQQQLTIYDFFSPKKTTPFKLKTKGLPHTKVINWEIKNAAVVE